MFKQHRKLWLALGALIVLSPLGLIASGTAFGEWGLDQLEEKSGFIPAGLAKMAGLWQHAPLPDYGIAGMDASFLQSGLGYFFSAVVGVVLVVGVISLLNKMIEE